MVAVSPFVVSSVDSPIECKSSDQSEKSDDVFETEQKTVQPSSLVKSAS